MWHSYKYVTLFKGLADKAGIYADVNNREVGLKGWKEKLYLLIFSMVCECTTACWKDLRYYPQCNL